MPRPARMRVVRSCMSSMCLLAAFAAGIAVQSGCTGALFSAMYLWKGNNVPAECDKLKDKKIVVVCRPLMEMEYKLSGATNEIAREVGNLIQANVKKARVVPQQEVHAWVDENSWDEHVQVGKALKADLVVGIDLGSFGLLQSQTVYQGQAALTVTVYDMQKGGEAIFEKEMPNHVYPPNTGVPTNGMPIDEFRRLFVGELSEEIAVLFYPHDAHRNFGKDGVALR